MVRTTSRKPALLVLLLFLAFSTLPSFADNSSWLADAVKTPFSQAPLHGQIDGIEFAPTVIDKIFQRSNVTGRAASAGHPDSADKISFKDGGGRQIDVTIYGAAKFENIMYSQSERQPVKGATKLAIANGLHNLSTGEYGIRISLGKISAEKIQPIYIILRIDRGNWMEGYAYARVHERTVD